MSDFDLVVHGATGFTGQLAAKELARTAESSLRWAISGRSESKLQALGVQLGVPYIVTDGTDESACERLAAQTRAVLSCAGPYQLYGSALLAACAASGTHYADLSGELGWIWEMIQSHDAIARRTGAVLLPAAGFDSVPSDLAALTLVRELQRQDIPVGDLTGFFRMKGGLNGGTLATGLAQSARYQPDELAHPFLLDPDPQQSWEHRVQPPPRDETFAIPALGGVAAPFIMSPINERVVRRSAALSDAAGRSYGADFSYAEYLRVSDQKKAKQLALGLKVSAWAMSKPIGRKLIERFGPSPGTGPSEQTRTEGFVELTVLAGDLAEPDARVDWFFPGDPGNTVTVRCLVQIGLALCAGEARDAGILTPAHALGGRLIERLHSRDALLDSF